MMKNKIFSNAKAQAQDIFKTVSGEAIAQGLGKKSSEEALKRFSSVAGQNKQNAADLLKKESREFIKKNGGDVLSEAKAARQMRKEMQNGWFTKKVNKVTDAVFGEGTSEMVSKNAMHKVFAEGNGFANDRMGMDYLSEYASGTMGLFKEKGKTAFNDYYVKPYKKFKTSTNKEDINQALKTMGVRYGLTAGAIGGGAYAAKKTVDAVDDYLTYRDDMAERGE